MMPASWNRIRRSEIFKHTSVLVSGTLIAQLIPILLQPVLRRLYSPETYGVFAVYLSLLGILYVGSSLRYEMAIALPKNDRQAVHLWILALFFNLATNSLLFLCIFIFGNSLLQLLNIPNSYGFYLYLLPLTNFLYSFYQATHYWLVRKRGFTALSVNKFSRRISEGTVQLAAGKGFSAYGLMLGDLTGHLINAILGVVQSLRKGLDVRMISRVKLKYVLKKYVTFPKYNLASSFMSAFSFLVPALLINKFFDATYAGFYDLSKMVLSIPLALVATSVANVLLQRFSEKRQQQKSLYRELLAVFFVIVCMAALEIIIIQLWGVELFSFVFGSEWETSGKISGVLVWAYAMSFVMSSFGSVFIALERVKLLSAWQIMRFLAILVLFTLNDISFTSFIKIYVMLESASFIVNFGLLGYVVRKYEHLVAVSKKGDVHE